MERGDEKWVEDGEGQEVELERGTCRLHSQLSVSVGSNCINDAIRHIVIASCNVSASCSVVY